MVGFRFSSLITLLLVATAAAASDGCPVCGNFMPPISYVTPAAYAYAPSPALTSPLCCAPRYACATPAPASPGPDMLNTHEPPLSKPGKGPTIYQNRTFSGIPQITEPRTQHCKVSFWNLSGFDVNLNIGERIVPIAKDRAAILDLNRSFSWRTNLHNPKAEEVPDDVNHFEVMIR